MPNIFADMIVALNNVYPKTITALTAFRAGTYDTAALNNAKQAIALYKVYSNQRLSIENGTIKNRKLLDFILTDLGEAPLFVERNISILRFYIAAYEPSYVEPA